METKEKTLITVKTTVDAPVEKVWNAWTDPKHIVKWNNASDDWHTTKADNDLRVGGKFTSTMAAKDGSAQFDFWGTYDKVETNKLIASTMGDGRKMTVSFSSSDGKTFITESFEAEAENSVEMQRGGWQAILDSFKKHVENLGKTEKIRFEKMINAPVEKVYKNMIDEKHYREWTSAFNATSHYKGSWAKGSKILFIGEDQDGKQGGMVSRIKENIPNQFLSIEHLGIVQGDKEITSGPEVEGWAGALENYTFTAKGNQTLLSVEMDSNEEFKSYFEETWPKALDKLKAICEK